MKNLQDIITQQEMSELGYTYNTRFGHLELYTNQQKQVLLLKPIEKLPPNRYLIAGTYDMKQPNSLRMVTYEKTK